MSAFQAPVAVTGASGYVASHVVRELIARGATVHATVRDPDDAAKVAHLTKLAEAGPGTLKLFAADLLKPGSFDAAFAGCGTVIHTASPFVIFGVKDPQKELVDPALEGTRNALAACSATPTVTRVVLTSSVVAMYADPADAAARGRPLDERDWNETSTLADGPYYLSKTLAEREAWKLTEGQSQWSLVTINPGFVMGPSLTARNDSASIDFLLKLIGGAWRTGMWNSCTAWVDVRDVAFAHVEAAVRPDAAGRHALVGESSGWRDAVAHLEAAFPGKLKLPLVFVPKFASYAMAPLMGFSWSYVTRNVDIPFAFDATKSREKLGVAYRPLKDTLREHVEQLARDGLFKLA